MQGSDGYIIERHPVAIVVAAAALLYVAWLVLKR
jgi:hypothetical protein